MTAAVNDLLDIYGQAWCEPDAARRLALLEHCWAGDGLYCDPTARTEGRAALSDLIAAVHVRFPGGTLEITSGAGIHHEYVQFSWRLLTADGAVAVQGVDFGTLDADGRLCQVIGFFGDLPPLP